MARTLNNLRNDPLNLEVEEDSWNTWHVLGGVVIVILLAALVYVLIPQSNQGDVGLDVEEPRTVKEQTQPLNGGFRLEKESHLEEVYLTGVYRGTGFMHVDNRTNPRMRITRDITPGNGIIEAYIIGYLTEQEGETVFAADVFIDEEFKNEVDDTVNVAWGNRFTDNFRAFKFTEVRDGIYRDTIIDEDISRFMEDGRNSETEANIAVGNFSPEDVRQQRMDGLTFVTAR